MFSVLFFVLNDRDGILHHMDGHKAPTIARLLRGEGVKVSGVGISKFLTKFEKTSLIGWKIGSGRPSKITAETKKLVENQVHSDVETTVYQLHTCLRARTTVSFFAQFYLLIENNLSSNVCNNT